MLHENIPKSFKDASRNAILTIYLDTTLQFEIYDGGAVVWTSATNIDFLVNFPSILMPDIVFKLAFLYPGLLFLSSYYWF